jgi:hypothetical protein
MNMPKLPEPTQGLGAHCWAYSKDDMIAYGRQCVEAAAAKCDEVYYKNIGPHHGEVRYGIAACAEAIRNMLKGEN